MYDVGKFTAYLHYRATKSKLASDAAAASGNYHAADIEKGIAERLDLLAKEIESGAMESDMEFQKHISHPHFGC